MPKSSKFYDHPQDDNLTDCYICKKSPSSLNLYHPVKVREGERGIKVSSCKACYVYYKTLNSPYGDFTKILEKLRSRRRNRSTAMRGDPRWHMDLQLNYLEFSDEIVYAANSLTGEVYDLEDVQKFVDKRDWLFEQPLNIVDSWCQEHLTDQRFINKIVTTFSS